MWQVVIEFYALENNFFDERSIQTCSPFSCCSLASFQFKLDKFIFIITIKQAAGCNKIQLMCKWQLHAFLQNSEVINNMSHAAWLMLHILYIGSVHPPVKSLFSKFQPLWVILFLNLVNFGEFQKMVKMVLRVMICGFNNCAYRVIFWQIDLSYFDS